MKLDCRQAQKMAGEFAEDSLNDRELASLLAHVRTCRTCYEELKTAYLISYALDYMDRDRNGGLDINELMEEKIRRSELRLRRHRMVGAALWAVVVILSLTLTAVFIRIMFPFLVPWLTDLINRLISYLPL